MVAAGILMKGRKGMRFGSVTVIDTLGLAAMWRTFQAALSEET